ncbi:MAG TPA: glycoside hydrolase family 3 C-terminal domain-containing protein [Candidatus Pygmaiobacter gallistercoris]|nr:glycoside hydrolase family 3 C-terminal domain-containing protein [Candidatus Pygmaiobacter gallistercoris]
MENEKNIYLATTNPEPSAREEENRAKSGLAAEEGMVLLKNDGVLPLAAGAAVALYGRGARRTVKGGTGSGGVNERSVVSIYEGLKNAGFRITTDDWLDDYDRSYAKANEQWKEQVAKRMEKGWSFDIFASTIFEPPAGGPVVPTDTDTAIFVVSRIAGENADRRAVPGDYYFSAEEERLLGEICAYYPKVVLVINAGGQVDLTVMDRYKNIAALIVMGMPGMEAGNAFAALIGGKATFSGKLVDSWTYDYKDFPCAEEYSDNDGNTYMEYYREGIYVGYRYFDTFDKPVRYGFGYGLSYTDFAIQTDEVTLEGTTLKVRATVTNTGDRFSGKEVVQVYATCPEGRLAKEFRRLIGFVKTGLLAPGASETVEIQVPAEYLKSYDEALPGWVLEQGSYYIWVGNSLAGSAIAAVVELDGETVIERTQNECVRIAEMEEWKADTAKDAYKRARCADAAAAQKVPVLPLSAGAFVTRQVDYRTNRQLACSETMAFVDQLTEEQLILLANGELRKDGTWVFLNGDPSTPGAVGETSRCARSLGLPSILMADGPAGLRLLPKYREKDGQLIKVKNRMGYSEGQMVATEEEHEPVEGEVLHYQYCTAIPTGTQIAQSWNTDLAAEMGRLVATEMEEFGITVWLAPGMNIHRNPLCGRNFEYFSEDPVVAGRMAAAITHGVQQTPGLAVMIKHFACNNQENNRHFSNSIVSERALREIYLRNFEIAVKEGKPWSVMSSYNLLNGVHAANKFSLCTSILRCEWGFEGIVCTDWRTTVHDGACTAAGCMRAGNDLVMPGFECDARNIKKELADGTLDIQDLKVCVSRLVSLVRTLKG